METKIKTYGVAGMVDWVVVLPMRHNFIRIHFTGGTLSGYGTTPATFTTDNAVVQEVIEHSSYYNNGKIRLLGDDEEEVVDNKPATETGNFKKEKR